MRDAISKKKKIKNQTEQVMDCGVTVHKLTS